MIPLRFDSGGGAVHGDSSRVTPSSWSTLRGAIVPVIVCSPIQLELVSLSTRLLDVEARVTIVVNDLSCICCPRMPGHKVIRYSSEDVLHGLSVFVVGVELAELDQRPSSLTRSFHDRFKLL